jgi:hypothetical protein
MRARAKHWGTTQSSTPGSTAMCGRRFAVQQWERSQPAAQWYACPVIFRVKLIEMYALGALPDATPELLVALLPTKSNLLQELAGQVGRPLAVVACLLASASNRRRAADQVLFC